MAHLCRRHAVDVESWGQEQIQIEATRLGDVNRPLAVVDQAVVFYIEPGHLFTSDFTLHRENLPGAPLLILVHMASVWVPFTSESKEAINDYDEIRKEINLAIA